MVCYCPKRRIVYIHVPKTGGITVDMILRKYYGFSMFHFNGEAGFHFLGDKRGKKGIWKYILKYSDEAKEYDLKSFYKFTFVRNPYDRMVSGINYVNKMYRRRKGTNIDAPPKIFLRAVEQNVFGYMHVLLSQCTCLQDDEGKINIDFIGRTETLMEDLQHVLHDILGFERRNYMKLRLNAHKGDKLEYDPLKIQLFVTRRFIDDFHQFGYEKKSESELIQQINDRDTSYS